MFINRKLTLIFALISSLGFSQLAVAEETETQGSQVQAQLEQLKKDVVALNRQLFILEEDLLFPASTQLAVFVSLDVGKFLKVDSVELKLNDQEIVGFLYTDNQRRALEQGGIQKLYVGNIKTGQHQLTAIFIGKDNNQREVKRAVSYEFEKAEDAVMIELKLKDNTANYQTQLLVDEWVL